MTLQLSLLLLSDATFGRGDGVAGLVDEEVEHDAATGLPFVRGRTIKGLLVEECANILFALEAQASLALERFQRAAKFLFGKAGSTLDDDGAMHVGNALLPDDLCKAVAADVQRDDLKPVDVLESLTAVRRQTAVDDATGAPDEGSLRSMRVVLRQTRFTAQLDFDRLPDEDSLALLAACALGLRRGGTGRNRGRGRLAVRLRDSSSEDLTERYYDRFRQTVGGERS